MEKGMVEGKDNHHKKGGSTYKLGQSSSHHLKEFYLMAKKVRADALDVN